jgi:hypothetical protein
MKAEKETTLFTVPSGSRLYGTFGPESDYDYKAVVLPKLDDLLLNKKVTNRKEKPEGRSQSDKVQAGESETEYLPLQVFFDDFFNGQTYALEVAFAVLNGESERVKPSEVQMMREMVDHYMTNSVKKMVGYAISQSKAYGLKNDRYTSLKKVVDTIKDYFGSETEVMRKTRLDSPESSELIDKILKFPNVTRIEILNAKGGIETAPGIQVISPKFLMSNTWWQVYSSLLNTLDSYGERVKSFEGQHADWKALSHAIRIVEQIVEISRTGALIFPRPNSDYLRSVKEGKETIEGALAYLDARFEEVDEAVAKSVLKEKTQELTDQFNMFKLSHLKRLYNLTAF